MPRRLLPAAALAAGLAAAPAFAQTAPFTVRGGGSTLAMNAYDRTAQAIATATGVGMPGLTGGLNTQGPSGTLAYAIDASGRGQQAFLLQDLSVHTGLAADIGAAVHYAASDAYLSDDQLACWNTGTAADCTAAGYAATPAVVPLSLGGPLIQLPALGTPVTVAFTTPYAKQITLDDADVCAIFSGRITDWSQVQTRPGGSAPQGLAGAISVVYRRDASGSSFLFTQHLARVCTGGDTSLDVFYAPTMYFADIFGKPTVSCTDRLACTHEIGPGRAPPWASFVAATNSAGVADALIGGINRVGYLTPDYTSVAPTALAQYVKAAAVLGLTPGDPGAPPSASPYQYIKVAKLLNQHSGRSYLPDPAATRLGLSNPGALDFAPGYPKAKTTALDPLRWVPRIADPTDGYPIVGTTTLDFATCYADPRVQGYIKAFLTQLYSGADKPDLKAEEFVALPPGFANAIMNVFVTGINTYGVNIGNPLLCNTSGVAGSYPGL